MDLVDLRCFHGVQTTFYGEHNLHTPVQTLKTFAFSFVSLEAHNSSKSIHLRQIKYFKKKFFIRECYKVLRVIRGPFARAGLLRLSLQPSGQGG